MLQKCEMLQKCYDCNNFVTIADQRPNYTLSKMVTRMAIRQAPRQGFRASVNSRAPPYARTCRSWELGQELEQELELGAEKRAGS